MDNTQKFAYLMKRIKAIRRDYLGILSNIQDEDERGNVLLMIVLLYGVSHLDEILDIDDTLLIMLSNILESAERGFLLDYTQNPVTQ